MSQQTIESVATDYPHLERHVTRYINREGRKPEYVHHSQLEYEDNPNVIYQVQDDVFAHIYGTPDQGIKYIPIQPGTTDNQLVDDILEKIVKQASEDNIPNIDSLRADKELIDNILEPVVVIQGEDTSTVDRLMLRADRKKEITEQEYYSLRDTIYKRIVGFSRIDTLMNDPVIEYIHMMDYNKCRVDHDVFGLIRADIGFPNLQKYKSFLKNLGERIDSPVSDADPIANSILSDGSRINIIYSDEIAFTGPSLTVKRQVAEPISMIDLVEYGTVSSEIAAYLWLAIENDATVFFAGETAAGKTTTLNASTVYTPATSKVLTIEDTPEVYPLQDSTQKLVTREQSFDTEKNVGMFDLLKSSLRMNPDRIIVGEIRGEETRVAFQAMQTGHPVMLTVHANNTPSLFRRLTGDPINVPQESLSNIDVVVFQDRMRKDDGTIVRRVTDVREVGEYSEQLERMETNRMFNWDAVSDEHDFVGMNSSRILEDKVLDALGYNSEVAAYRELDRRSRIIDRLIRYDYVDSHRDFYETVQTINRESVASLDMDVSGLIEIEEP